jgi:hypothetical protein
MRACCDGARDRKTPTWARRARETAAWVFPGAILVVLPKCPACLAAHVALWTGLGLSLAAAAYLRWGLLLFCVASLLWLVVKRLNRLEAIFRNFQKETERCNTKS